MSAATPNPAQPDPITLARQMSCQHAFIKGMADATKHCGKCGVSWAAWEAIQAQKSAYAGSGVFGLGVHP